VKARVLTDAEGRVLFCSPGQPGHCVDITQARQLGLVELLTDGPFMQVLADAGYHTFKKNPPAWYETQHGLQRKAHSSRRIPVEHGNAHLKIEGLLPTILAVAST
jgi:hypothetical protein